MKSASLVTCLKGVKTIIDNKTSTPTCIAVLKQTLDALVAMKTADELVQQTCELIAPGESGAPASESDNMYRDIAINAISAYLATVTKVSDAPEATGFSCPLCGATETSRLRRHPPPVPEGWYMTSDGVAMTKSQRAKKRMCNKCYAAIMYKKRRLKRKLEADTKCEVTARRKTEKDEEDVVEIMSQMKSSSSSE